MNLLINFQVALFEELLKPKYSVSGFKTKDLKSILKEHFRNSAQIRYILKKLIVRKVVKKQKNLSFYELSKKDGAGYGFQFPILSKTLKKSLQNNVA